MPFFSSGPGLLALAAGVLGAALVGLVFVAIVYLRHVRWKIPLDLRALPSTPDTTGVRLRFSGISGYELRDGTTTLLLDPVITRPTVLDLITGPLEPRTDAARRAFPRADFILVDHGHYDHAIDAPAIALASGATIIGSQSVCNLALSRGLRPDRVREAKAGDRLQLGTFAVEVAATTHSPVLGIDNPMVGTVAADAGALWFWQYTQDACLTFRLTTGSTSVLFNPSSNLAPTTAPEKVGTVIFGMSGRALTADTARQIVETVTPDRVLPTHYDNFS